MRKRAPFIWSPRQPIDADVTFGSLLRNGFTRRDDGVNRWFAFRRRVKLAAAADRASVEITADSRYQLFVNGRRVGRGPSRCAPTHQRVDHHDVASLLTAGDNVLAVLVHVYGVDTAWYETSKEYWQSVFGDGALYVSAVIECGTVRSEITGDTEWRCMQCHAWRQDAPRSGWGQGFIEDYDAQLMLPGWTEVKFDDAGWDRARVQERLPSPEEAAKGWGVVKPFPTLVPRDIPALLETPVQPKRIAGVWSVLRRPELPLDRLPYEEPFDELPSGLVRDPEALLRNDDSAATVRTDAQHDVAMLLEFEARHAGYPAIEIEAAGGEVVEVAVAETIPGEYGDEPRRTARLARGSHLDCAHVFRYTARPGLQRFEKFDWTGVKFLQLVVRNAPRGLRIRRVESIHTHYPAQRLGAFECSDAALTRLWEAGCYTALECTHDAWEDCPGREKRQWVGDGIVHYLVAAAAFGPSTHAIDRQFLIHATESQRADGLMQMFAPGDHHGAGMTIPDFTLHWIGAAHAFYLHSGDLETVLQILPALQRALEWFERQRGGSGLVADLPHWHFIEWARVERSGESFVVNAMLAGMLSAAVELARGVGFERLAQEYARRATSIRTALRERHWDAARGVYVDSVDPTSGAKRPQVSQHANAAAILWDVAAESQWSRILASISDPRRLRLTAVPPVTLREEPFDPLEHVVRANTFFGHFLYAAYARVGRFDLALNAMREQYAPMLAAGSETLWESIEPAASLCHAFSASPVHQLSAHCLGVSPVSPGFSQARIAPQLGDLAWARGVYPTVRGGIEVEWRRRDARTLDLAIVLPEGVEARVVAPAPFKAPASCEGLRGRQRFTLTA